MFMELNATAFQGIYTKVVVVNIAISSIPKHNSDPNEECNTSELQYQNFSHIGQATSTKSYVFWK